MSTSKVPEPGIHRGVPMADYHSWLALSNSWLTELRRSPAHLAARLKYPQADTPAMLLGRAVHAAVLEPDTFAERFGKAPEKLDRRTKAGKAEWADLQQMFGADILTHDDFKKCMAIRDAVWKKRTSKMLKGSGDIEVSVVWQERNGVLSKARMDRVSKDLAGGTIVDLKTTTDASLLQFERRIFQMGYHRQGAWYLRAAAAQGIKCGHYTIIAIEKEPPYESATYRLTEQAIDAGWQQIEPLLDIYAECAEKNDWPGYPDEVKDIGLPPYAWGQIEDETAVTA